MYINIETKEIVGINTIRKEFPNVSIPNGADLVEFGYEKLIETERPEYDISTQKLVEGLDEYTQTWEVVDLTEEEMEAIFKASIPQVITKRQMRLALLQADLLSTIDEAIKNGTDEEMRIEWEYSDEVRRDWNSLNAMATDLEMTEKEVDDLFILAGGL